MWEWIANHKKTQESNIPNTEIHDERLIMESIYNNLKDLDEKLSNHLDESLPTDKDNHQDQA